MPETKVEDNAKKHVLAKIRTEMTDTIVRDSADLATELMLINAGIRGFNDKKGDSSGHLVNRKLPQLIEKYSVVVQETEKRQKHFQDLRLQLAELREQTKLSRDELSKVRACVGTVDRILHEQKVQAERLDDKLVDMSNRKLLELNSIGDLSKTLSIELGFRLDPHSDGVRVKFTNGKHFIINNSTVLDGTTMNAVVDSFDALVSPKNGSSPVLSQFDSIVNAIHGLSGPALQS